MKSIPPVGRYGVKIAISAGLLWFLLGKVSLSKTKVILASADRGLFLLSLLVLFGSNLLGAVQWHLLLNSSGVGLPFHRTFRFYFIGLFFNNFLPANVGGDAVKVYDVTKVGSDVYRVLAVTILDRVLGIFSLSLLAFLAALGLLTYDSSPLIWLYLALFLACMIPALGLYVYRPLGRLLRRAVMAIKPLSLDMRISRILDQLSQFRGRRDLLAKLVVLSLVIQAMRVATHIVVGASLGIEMASTLVHRLFVFVPILALAMVPPITINGLGVREGLGMVLFAQAGIGRTDAFLMEFITYLVSVILSLIGWTFFLARRGKR